MMMHGVLARQLKRHGLEPETLPRDLQSWSDLLASIDHAYQQADQDRYLLERSLALSSDEMGALHRRLAAERDLITRVTCSLVEGVCAVDNDGDVLFLNPEARRLLGIAADADVSGCPLVELAEATSADGKTLDSVLREFTAASTGGADEPRLIVNGDQSVFITFTVSALGAQQDAGGVVLTLHDVTERKRMESERRELNNRLIAMSRQAGMAEVASDVLHNVGNVLNSVNVSASVATDLVRESRREGIVKLARLLEANRGTLPEFLATDPAGSRAIEYLAEIGVELMREQGQVCDELAKVRKSIDHIRDIVGAQQSWA